MAMGNFFGFLYREVLTFFVFLYAGVKKTIRWLKKPKCCMSGLEMPNIVWTILIMPKRCIARQNLRFCKILI